MTKKTTTKPVTEIPPLEFVDISIKIESISPLIVSHFSSKARKMILDKQMGKAKAKKHEPKDPDADYLASIYWIDDKKGITGFPAVGFKSAMVRAGKALGHAMTDTRGAIFVKPDHGDLIQIHGEHRKREDTVRLTTGVADIRFRAEYPKWKATLNIQFNLGVISKDQVAQLVELAGFSCGVGEWRPEKSNTGSFGRWQIAK